MTLRVIKHSVSKHVRHWSWFDVNRSTVDEYMRKKNLHCRYQWPSPLTSCLLF